MSIYDPKKPKRINSVSVSFAILFLVLGYLGWAFGPIYWPLFQLKGMMRSACNDAYRIYDNDEVIEKLVVASRRTGLRLAVDNFRLTRIPMSAEEIEADVSRVENPANRRRRAEYLRERGKECVLEFYHRGTYQMPLIGTTITLPLSGRVQASLETVTW